MGERRGRPSKEYRETLKGMTEQEYAMLEKACVQAYLTGKKHVILVLSHLTSLADDFPNVTTVKRVGKNNHVKVRASLLLKWLFDKGHTAFTSEDIRIAQIRFTSAKEKTLALPRFDWLDPELDRGGDGR